MNTDLTNTAIKKARAILNSECSPIDLMASPEGYPHVWARDSVITSLGALLTPGHELCLKRSLETLAGQQSELGAIPNNVSVATGRLDHTNAGSVDSNLWFILGHAFQYRASADDEFLRGQWPALEQALLWLRYQFGNLLSILFDVANPAQEKRILDYLHQVGIADPYPVRVLHPVIHPGNKDWHEYYRNNNLNLPEQYHNGGIWSFVGGFYVAALVKAGRLGEACKQLSKLAEVNRLGVDEEWDFNEWCHGRTGQPMGYPHQAWSAGLYVFAHHCVTAAPVPFLSAEASEESSRSPMNQQVSLQS